MYHSQVGSIHYEVSGVQSNFACVFIHGVGLNQKMFEKQVEALSPYVTCISFDLPGHGKSEKLKSPLKVEEVAHVIAGLCEQLNVNQYVVVGQSLGSWIAQHCAIVYPHHVIGVVNISGTPIEQQLNPLLMSAFNLSLWLSHLMPARAMFKLTANYKAISKPAQDFAFNSMNVMGKKQFLYSVHGMLNASALSLPHGVLQPMLIAHGDHEMPKFVAKVGLKWHQCVPSSMYFVIPHAGHNGNQDNPHAFNDVLLTFLNSLHNNG